MQLLQTPGEKIMFHPYKNRAFFILRKRNALFIKKKVTLSGDFSELFAVSSLCFIQAVIVYA